MKIYENKLKTKRKQGYSNGQFKDTDNILHNKIQDEDKQIKPKTQHRKLKR